MLATLYVQYTILYVQDSISSILYVQYTILYVQGSRIAILYAQNIILHVQDSQYAILYVQGTILYVQDNHIFCGFFNACRFQSFVPLHHVPLSLHIIYLDVLHHLSLNELSLCLCLSPRFSLRI